MNRAKRIAYGRIKPPTKYAQLLATRRPSAVRPNAQLAAIRIKLGIPYGQPVPTRQQRRAAARKGNK